jgi:retinol-binding protein 3
MKWLRDAAVVAVLLALGGTMPARGQATPGDATSAVDAATRAQIVDKLTQLLRDKYVDAGKGAEIAAHVRQSLAAGTYDGAANAAAFGEAVTQDLQSLGIDRHLRVRFEPQLYAMASDTTRGPRETPPAEIKRRARDNFGFQKLEILMGNVGYLDLRGFVPPEYAGPTAVGAMNFLANSDALIIDLRSNGGGTPEMIQLLTTYLFGPERQHLNDFYVREGDETHQFWTLPYVPGTRLEKIPVYVLTSKRTFSAAEEFTYDLQNLKRATIVGETTGGGAHPGGWFPLDAGFVAFVSTGKAVNPVSKKNWEGTGVKPDIEVPKDDALRVAHLEALKAIAATESDPERKTSLAWSAEALESEAHPVSLSTAELRAYAGVYGIRKVTVEGGQLWFQREEQPRVRLIPLGKDQFRGEFMDDMRFRFMRDANGKVCELGGLAPRGPLFSERRSK